MARLANRSAAVDRQVRAGDEIVLDEEDGGVRDVFQFADAVEKGTGDCAVMERFGKLV